jgi:hypothetical protein
MRGYVARTHICACDIPLFLLSLPPHTHTKFLRKIKFEKFLFKKLDLALRDIVWHFGDADGNISKL